MSRWKKTLKDTAQSWSAFRRQHTLLEILLGFWTAFGGGDVPSTRSGIFIALFIGTFFLSLGLWLADFLTAFSTGNLYTERAILAAIGALHLIAIPLHLYRRGWPKG